ncbi:MAG: precorrin-8X methylmutase [Clostridia bacterium]|nr:precorrin-8X methylmutase [Clostridia bacterium]
MARPVKRSVAPRRALSPYVSPLAEKIIKSIEDETSDTQFAKSLYFSPTALTHIKRTIQAGGTIVVDTQLMEADIDLTKLEGTSAQVKCFIDDNEVVKLAEIRRTTRAEIAVDIALALPGPKLMVVGSAPAALNRILVRRKSEPLSDVCVLAAPAGFATVVQLKEKLRDSDMAYIVARGKMGGVSQTAILLNTILEEIHKEALEQK